MIPILSGILAGEGEQITPKRGFILSSSYVLGMAIVYTMAGIISASIGLQLQAFFNAPWVIIIFVAIFIWLALAMFNFCASKDVLEVGDVVYIRPIKMTRLLHKKEVVASSQMSLEEFSQVHAVRKKVLMRLNKMNATDTIFKGDVIVLGRGLF